MGQNGRGGAWLSMVAAVIGLCGALLTVGTQLGAFGDARVPGLPGRPTAGPDGGGGGGNGNGGNGEQAPPCNAASVNPVLGLSTGRGPSGTIVTVTGEGYCPDALLEIRFHTRTIGEARTGAEGTFSVDVTIPGTFDAFAPGQFDIVAFSAQAGSARVPFELTTG